MNCCDGYEGMSIDEVDLRNFVCSIELIIATKRLLNLTTTSRNKYNKLKTHWSYEISGFALIKNCFM